MNPIEAIREVLRELCDVVPSLPPHSASEADRLARILDRSAEELHETADDLRVLGAVGHRLRLHRRWPHSCRQ